MRILFYILFLALTAWVGIYLYQTPGNLTLSFQDLVVDMPLWIAVTGSILLLFVLSLILSFFSAISRSYRRFKEWLTGSTLRAVTKNANQGYLAYAEGDWSRAETCMLKAAKHSEYPLHFYMTAAKAAHKQCEYENRDNYLHLASKVDPEAKLAVGILQVKLLIKQGNYETSWAILQELQRTAPHNHKVMQLLIKVLTKKAEWLEIAKLLPQVKKHMVITAEEYSDLEAKVYSNLLMNEAAKSSLVTLESYWDSLPKSARQQTEVILSYVKILLDAEAVDQAESVLRGILKKQLNPKLVKLYGMIVSSDLSKQIAFAESLLKSNSNDATLLLTLARLCIAHRIWGKARGYLELSISLQPDADAYAELGRLLGFLGEQQKSIECYKTGLLEFAAVLPIEGV